MRKRKGGPGGRRNALARPTPTHLVPVAVDGQPILQVLGLLPRHQLQQLGAQLEEGEVADQLVLLLLGPEERKDLAGESRGLLNAAKLARCGLCIGSGGSNALSGAGCSGAEARPRGPRTGRSMPALPEHTSSRCRSPSLPPSRAPFSRPGAVPPSSRAVSSCQRSRSGSQTSARERSRRRA